MPKWTRDNHADENSRGRGVLNSRKEVCIKRADNYARHADQKSMNQASRKISGKQ